MGYHANSYSRATEVDESIAKSQPARLLNNPSKDDVSPLYTIRRFWFGGHIQMFIAMKLQLLLYS
jgi:hypothetical protein